MAVWYSPNHGTEFSDIGTVFGQFKTELRRSVSRSVIGSGTTRKCISDRFWFQDC